ncbi:iron complex transport system substrate-binding protein [Amphibacillus marinus]|uniref:Iron complex transport system substrate-binding protein n=1 Tax=Amphibacillus marinus TaxID=872970 RepID=A0A1H8KEG9_9BACI|nr:iron-siderophore ABC transporter substrate-binding protein [Amphibacillus marinus]SEN91167.1 iron complex transport system substrate-binding protein [Amphibacillus marinus]
MKKILILIALFTLILVGCMAQDDAPADQTAEEPTEDQTVGEITIVDGLGEHTFDGPQERIVAIEWNVAEELLAVGVQPVAVTDVEGFNKWVTIDQALDESVVDVGLRQEPNIEEIAKLEPDVIVGVTGYQEAMLPELEKIAPVVLLDSQSEEAIADIYASTLNNLRTVAQLVGKEQEAEAAITRVEDRMAEAQANIEAADLATLEFVFTQAYSSNDVPEFRLFTPNSMVSHVLEGMGLTNKIQDQEDEAYGFITANVEGVANYQEALFIHTVQLDDPLFENLSSNSAWNSLHFVENDLMFDAGSGVWTFGSVLSMETLINNVEEALTK